MDAGLVVSFASVSPRLQRFVKDGNIVGQAPNIGDHGDLHQPVNVSSTLEMTCFLLLLFADGLRSD